VSPDLSARRAERLRAAANQPPDQVVVDPLNEWTCAGCATSGHGLLLMLDDEPHCLRRSGLELATSSSCRPATRHAPGGRIAPAA
jgi:hypothetical protein